jgi:hypothetical protein
MKTELQDKTKDIVEENTAYVLGMYDLYQDDQEIVDAMFAKGIDEKLIPLILRNIQVPAYKKRIKQAKRKIVTGTLTLLLFTGVYLFFSNLPDSQTILQTNTRGMDVLIWLFKFYRELFYFAYFIVALQIIVGVVLYKRYSKLLKTSEL